MRKEWRIRKAALADSAGLRRCMASAYARYQDRMSGVRLPPMDLDYSREILDYPTWVAVIEDRVVGGLTMTFEEGFASIANIAVDPDFQGRGIGGRLMKFAEKEARVLNHSELRLATHVMLTENVSLYSHLGWTEYDRDAVRVYMKKDI